MSSSQNIDRLIYWVEVSYWEPEFITLYGPYIQGNRDNDLAVQELEACLNAQYWISREAVKNAFHQAQQTNQVVEIRTSAGILKFSLLIKRITGGTAAPDLDGLLRTDLISLYAVCTRIMSPTNSIIAKETLQETLKPFLRNEGEQLPFRYGEVINLFKEVEEAREFATKVLNENAGSENRRLWPLQGTVVRGSLVGGAMTITWIDGAPMNLLLELVTVSEFRVSARDRVPQFRLTDANLGSSSAAAHG